MRCLKEETTLTDPGSARTQGPHLEVWTFGVHVRCQCFSIALWGTFDLTPAYSNGMPGRKVLVYWVSVLLRLVVMTSKYAHGLSRGAQQLGT